MTTHILNVPGQRDSNMNTQRTSPPKKWFILIGIDCYERPESKPNHESDCSNQTPEYHCLKGAVQDIQSMREYIEKNMADAPEKYEIIGLTSSGDKDGPAEPKREGDKLPTYENIVDALKNVTEQSCEGGFVYIHYSGHGGRVKTAYPELAWKNGYDQALVPYNVNKGGTYFRDVEFNLYLREMSNKGLIVNVILDCCHSGGVHTGRGNADDDGDTNLGDPRSISRADETLTDKDKRQAEKFKKNLEKDLEGLQFASCESSEGPRDIRLVPGKHWLLLPPNGQVEVLAACHLHETAWEIQPKENPGVYYGVFTYLLLKCLNLNGTELTLDHLRQDIGIRCEQHKRVQQRPVLGGSGRNNIFGVPKNGRLSSTIVIQQRSYIMDPNAIVLDKGQPHGVVKGAVYAICSWDTVKLPQNTDQLPLARVSDVLPLKSMAHFISDASTIDNVVGSQAIEIYRPPSSLTILKFPVSLEDIFYRKSRAHRKKLKTVVSAQESCRIKLLKPRSTQQPKYIIKANKSNGNYSLLHHSPERPVVGFQSEVDAKSFVKLLQHADFYEKIKSLQSGDDMSKFYKCDLNIDDKLASLSGKYYQVSSGQEFGILLENKSDVPLYFSIFNFNPDLSIVRIHPHSDSGTYETLQNNTIPECITIEASRPSSYGSEDLYIDCVRILITTKPTSFDCLEKKNLETILIESLELEGLDALLKRFISINSDNNMSNLEEIASLQEEPNQVFPKNLGNSRNMRVVNKRSPTLLKESWAVTQFEIQVNSSKD